MNRISKYYIKNQEKKGYFPHILGEKPRFNVNYMNEWATFSSQLEPLRILFHKGVTLHGIFTDSLLILPLNSKAINSKCIP